MTQLAGFFLFLAVLSWAGMISFAWPDHQHKWKIVGKARVWSEGADPNGPPQKIVLTLQCETCGKIKNVKGTQGGAMNGPTDDFWSAAGFALVILAILLGMGGCFSLIGHAYS